MSYYSGPYSGGYPGRTFGSPYSPPFAPYSSPYSSGFYSGYSSGYHGMSPFHPLPPYNGASYFRPSTPLYSSYNYHSSAIAPYSSARPMSVTKPIIPSYSTPLSTYAPPVASFGTTFPTTTYSSSTTAPFLPTPITSVVSGVGFNNTFPYSAPQFNSYSNYLASAPVTFAPRSYADYLPYSPAGSYFPSTFPTTTFSAYGGYRGLEQPLDFPILALPVPPSFATSITLPAPPVTLSTPLISSGSVLPAAAPEDVPVEGEQQVEEEPKEEEVQEEIRVEAVEPEQKAPWAGGEGEEEFDLEYSRQVAARKVGEEE